MICLNVDMWKSLIVNKNPYQLLVLQLFGVIASVLLYDITTQQLGRQDYYTLIHA